MRNIDLDILNQQMGLEPINVIEVHWSKDNVQLYADKTLGQIPGSIITLSNLNDVLRLDSSGSSGTINIVLSDLDGSLKTIYDSIDIHLKTVKIYQQFSETNRFLLFEGGIASPIVWDEGERTLSFDVISRLLDVDVGFAPYDGQFVFLNSQLVGKAWPLPFGTVQMLPVISIQEDPTGILMDPFGIPDKGIPEQIWRLNQQYAALKPKVVASVVPIGSTIAETNKIIAQDAAALQAALDQIQLQKNDILKQISQLQATWTLQSKYVRKEVTIYSTTIPNGTYIFKADDTFFKGTFTRKDLYTGVLSLHIDTQNWIPDYQFYLDEAGFPKFGRPGALQFSFRYFTSGTGLSIVSNFPLKHIVSAINGTVKGVYAYRNYNGLRQLALVPQQYYQIEYGLPIFQSASSGESVSVSGQPSPEQALSAWISPVLVTLKGSLNMLQYMQQLGSVDITQAPTTSNLDQIYSNLNSDYQFGATYSQGEIDYTQTVRPREEWETDLFVVFESSVGPDPIDIISWVITTFSSLEYDDVNFAAAKISLNTFSMDFALFEKKSLTQFLNEMAIHLCSYIYVKNEKFYIIDLRNEPASIDTVTENDIQEKSLQLQSTETENLITKYVGTFKDSYLPSNIDTKIVLYNNVEKYGIKIEEFNYYAYNNYFMTYTSIIFWMTRKSNTWKRIVFKTFLNKLNIETMDCVTLDFQLIRIADQPIKGLVESAIYSSSDNTIEMSVWIPVRLGELKQHPIVWTNGMSIETVNPLIATLFSGSGSVIPPSQYDVYKFPIPPASGTEVNFDPSGTLAKGKAAFVDQKDAQYFVWVWYPRTDDDDLYDQMYADQEAFLLASQRAKEARDRGIPLAKGIKPNIPGPGPIPKFNYDLKDYKPSQVITKQADSKTDSVFPGKVISGTGIHYIVKIYPDGLNADGQDVNVTQLDLDSTETIDPDTWVMVTRIHDVDNKILYYMQVPIWL